MRSLTEQETFWIGDFGREYISRNPISNAKCREHGRWRKILSRCDKIPRTILEFGCNIGINLMALSNLLPDSKLCGIEINAIAANQARQYFMEEKNVTILQESIYDSTESGYDFVFTSGLLIHLNPKMLHLAYQRLYTASSRYICISEYYNTTPVSIPYRGHEEKLYKRDFAGEFLDTFGDVRLIDYGFLYRRDPVYPEGDTTWFLLEKQAQA